MKKGLLLILAIVMVVSMLFAGCSQKEATTNSTADYYAEEAAYDKTEAEAPMAVSEDMDTDAGEAIDDEAGTNVDLDNSSSILEPSVDRKIIYSGYISARTKKFEEDYANILAKVKEAGGYIENAYSYGTKPEEWQDEGRYAEITLRVPSDKFDDFIAMLEGVGETTDSRVSGQDISLQYFDIETRLETLRIREERLQELLDKAASLEDIIELERELANVSYEIQSYEIEKRNYDSLIDFSQITITLQEVQDTQEIVPTTESFGSRMSNAFYSMLNGLADFFRDFMVAMVYVVPILIILGIILAIVLLSVRAGKKRRAKKQNNQNNDQQ